MSVSTLSSVSFYMLISLSFFLNNKNSSHLGFRPTHMNSWHLNFLFKSTIFKFIHIMKYWKQRFWYMDYEVKWKSLSWFSGLYSPWHSTGQNTGVGNLSLLQRLFQPRGWIQVSHTAGRFFTTWATREAQYGLCVCVCVSHSVMSDSLWPHGLLCP